MRSRAFTVSLYILGTLAAWACGPDMEIIHYPFEFHFYQEKSMPGIKARQQTANISGWQSLTGGIFSDEEIVEGVYHSTLAQLSAPDNWFMKRLRDGKSNDLADFLLLAKEVEELREHIASPWYYPASRVEYLVPDDPYTRLRLLRDSCNGHMPGRLSDRYALQAIRISRSLRDYSGCLANYDAHLKTLPDSNIIKQMAQAYVVGCHMNLGDTIKANDKPATAGDLDCWSRATAEQIKAVAFRYPESYELKSRLDDLIGYNGALHNLATLQIADEALRSPKVVNRGDWLYLKAFIQFSCGNDYRQAEYSVKRALRHSFSNKEIENAARLFNIYLSTKNGTFANFAENAKWLTSFCAERRNEALFFIIPELLRHGKDSWALLLANTMNRESGYASTGCMMLLSSSPEQVKKYKDYINRRPDRLARELADSVITDDDYLDDIIGTLYLRRGDYANAARYLSQVSEKYQRSTTLYQGNYLIYNPWDYAYQPPSKWDYPSYKPDYEWEPLLYPVVHEEWVSKLNTQINAKQNFAHEMARLHKVITTADDNEERNLARIRFAIGRYNSFNTCWALTQYWTAGYSDWFNPYCYFGEKETLLDFIIDAPREMAGVEDWFVSELNDAYAKLQTDAAKATANMMLRNYRTIARRYPDTPEGRYLASHCDHWSDWL